MASLDKLNKRVINFLNTLIRNQIKAKVGQVLGKAALKEHGQQIYQQVNQAINNSKEITSLVSQLVNTIDKKNLLSAQQKYIYSHLDQIEILTEVANYVTNTFTKHYDWLQGLTPVTLTVHEIPQDMIESSLKEYIEMYLVAEDKRIQTDEKSIRRMDSLARILGLPAKLSACSAVAFAGGEIFISANVSAQGTQGEITQVLTEKLKMISEMIAEISKKFNQFGESADFYHVLDSVSSDYANRILESSNSGGHDFSRLQQDLSKFAHAVILKEDYLDQELCKAWLDFEALPYTILLPNEINREVEVSIHSQNSKFTSLDNYVIKPIQDSLKIARNYHAEQLLVHTLFNELQLEHNYGKDNLLTIGISKLCCYTCYDGLQKLPVKIRGTHGQAYQNVIAILNADFELTHTPKGNLLKGPTTAKDSVIRSHHISRSRREFFASERTFISSPQKGAPGRMPYSKDLSLEPLFEESPCRKLDFSSPKKESTSTGSLSCTNVQLFIQSPLRDIGKPIDNKEILTNLYQQFFNSLLDHQERMDGELYDYLRQRHNSYYCLDMLESTIGWLINGLARILGISTTVYQSEQQKRESYITELDRAIVEQLKSDTPNIDGIRDQVEAGLTLFKPRSEDNPHSLKFLLDELATPLSIK